MAATQGADDIVPKMDNHSSKSVTNSASDLEKQQTPQGDELQRKLSSRHLQFVAIGMFIVRAIKDDDADVF
jgi:amino acid transporter